MKYLVDTHDKAKDRFPEQEYTEEQFFEHRRARGGPCPPSNSHPQPVRKRQTLRQPRKAHSAISLPYDAIAETRRVTGADVGALRHAGEIKSYIDLLFLALVILLWIARIVTN